MLYDVVPSYVEVRNFTKLRFLSLDVLHHPQKLVQLSEKNVPLGNIKNTYFMFNHNLESWRLVFSFNAKHNIRKIEMKFQIENVKIFWYKTNLT